MTVPDETIVTAEKIVSEALGGTVQLEITDRLGGNRSRVVRCKVLDKPSDAPPTVIVKEVFDRDNEGYDVTKPYGPASRLFNEWASLQFLRDVMGDLAPAPLLYGGDSDIGLLVMEDLGEEGGISQLLVGNDAIAAENALIEMMRVVGRMQACTIGKKRKFSRIRKALGPQRRRSTVAAEQRRLLRTFHQGCDMVGVIPHRGVDSELQAVATLIAKPGAFDVFTQGDPCPSNDRRSGGVRKLFDFEFGGYRYALRDAIHARFNFPTCGLVNRLPGKVILAMEEKYRTELGKACPAANDDTLFYRAVVEACADWLIGNFLGWMLSNALEDSEAGWGTATLRQRILLRLDIFAQITAEFGHLQVIGETVLEMATKLRTLWTEAEELPYYPAFR